ncbi:MAG TPA: uracil-DNA glycosylase family protein [Ignavibacteriaceae bacterium]|nr:uracil-DNA glycosylase family protein [Ignavibacteriaceae bacterium]
METFAGKAVRFYLNLNIPSNLPEDIQIINPYENEEVKKIVGIFFKKYFDNSNERTFIFGINPGRFGGGLTGICFTDPAALRDYCGIENDLGSKKELSSKFIYKVIEEYGGAERFYSKYYLTALFPLPVLQHENNFNYYDNPSVLKILKPHLESSFKNQIEFGAKKDTAFCLGNKNYKFLCEINKKYNFFRNINVLYHPRYIMQYKLKHLDKYVREYLLNLQ